MTFNSIHIFVYILFISQPSYAHTFNSLICHTSICGNNTISYPFWKITGDSLSTDTYMCGYSGLGIDCLGDKPIIYLHDSLYYIRSVNLTNNTLTVEFQFNSFQKCPDQIPLGLSIIDSNNNCSAAKDGGLNLHWRKTKYCENCEKTGGRCSFKTIDTKKSFACVCPDVDAANFFVSTRNNCYDEGSKRVGKSKVMIETYMWVCGVVLVVAGLLFGFYYLTSCKSTSPLVSSENNIVEMDYRGVQIFSHSELDEATQHFDSTKKLGGGGFGSVYLGKLKDGREVAVKKLNNNNPTMFKLFMNEVTLLACLRQKNLVTLYGCSPSKEQDLLLVYEYISNGTVAEHLHKGRSTSLPMETRMNIAVETANALAYLHAMDVVHRDIKTDNILLDDNFCVKVGDFGISRLFPTNASHLLTDVQGTIGYLDPTYFQCGWLTNKSDVYSFGMVLLELLSSKRAVDNSRPTCHANLACMAKDKMQKGVLRELVDTTLGFETDDRVTQMIIDVTKLAFRCLENEKDLRPTMNEVCNILKSIQNNPIHNEELVIQPENQNTEFYTIIEEIDTSIISIST